MTNIFDDFTKKYGQHARLATDLKPLRKIPTGIFPVDYYTDGGFPEGHITLIAGKEHGGKTTMALKAMANAQKKYPDKHAFWVNAENAFDLATQKAEDHGVDLSRVTVLNTKDGHKVTDMLCHLLENNSHNICFIGIDSVNALLESKEYDKKAEDHQMAYNASVVTKMMKRISGILLDLSFTDNEVPAVVGISQIRANLGFGFKDYIIPGAKAAKHYAATIIVTNSGMTTEDTANKELSIQEFKITFDKVKVSAFNVKSTEYNMCVGRSQTFADGAPIPTGLVLDADFSIRIAKSHGIHNNGRSKQILNTPELSDITFGNTEELSLFLYNNPEQYALLKSRLMMARREEKKILSNEVYLEYEHGQDLDYLLGSKEAEQETKVAKEK